MNRLAMKIKESRIAAGLTEKQLAKKCGLSVGYILQVESGKKIVNESIAEKILKALGTKEEFVTEEKPAPEPKQKKEAPRVQETVIAQPNETWADALAGVIKKYPIQDIQSGKAEGYKELPIISKKIEGHHPDKIIFVKSPNDDMESFRIQKGDVLMVFVTKDIQNDGIYLFEVSGKKMIRQLRKDANKQIRLSKRSNDPSAVTVDMDRVKVIGRVIKNEFSI